MALMVLWTWRRRGRRALWRMLVLITISVCCIVGSSAASIFSSRIFEVGDEVLLRGDNCSTQGTYLQFADKESDPYDTYIIPHQVVRTTQIENAANYALQCYGSAGGTELDCGTFVQKRLPLTAQMNATCPFNSTLCKTQDKNMILDTGFLDSNDHFGINAPPKDRFLYRRVMHCAPLVTEGHSWAATDRSGNPVTRYSYEDPINGSLPVTYQYSNQTANTRNDYELGVVPAFFFGGNLQASNSMMIPSNDLTQGRTDADIMLLFLSANAIAFAKKTDDPWYAASTAVNFTTVLRDENGDFVKNETSTQYFQTEVASPLGCRLQDQFCNPNKPLDVGCSPLGPIFDPVTRSIAEFDEDYEGGLARLGWFTFILQDMVALHNVVRTMGAHTLQSRYRLTSDGTQGQLPDNQWMIDIKYWLEINLASMQAAAVLAAQGPKNAVEEPLYSVKPNLTVEFDMCHNQKILSKDHSSFSVLGLGVTIAVGLLIVISSYSLDPIMSHLQRKYRMAEYRRLEWSTNGILQQQRLAFEGVGQGMWSRTDSHVPMTRKREHLAELDISNRSHPRLGSITVAEKKEPTLSLLTLDKSVCEEMDWDVATIGHHERVRPELHPTEPLGTSRLDGWV
ncbi:hypothetical protein B0H67DRAFT_180194 [Lasiosphaeris hirsuta]|uniref:Uncharacterized protein n=1 Tax=Lasiosphaeris hirsuta TaxID=260670 RepID=A0AA40AQP3_9PEZI|nr:hypothetical protein B0H67DRAFT_180194 [Lasiosphaeris hirsuta]